MTEANALCINFSVPSCCPCCPVFTGTENWPKFFNLFSSSLFSPSKLNLARDTDHWTLLRLMGKHWSTKEVVSSCLCHHHFLANYKHLKCCSIGNNGHPDSLAWDSESSLGWLQATITGPYLPVSDRLPPFPPPTHIIAYFLPTLDF